MGMVVWIGNYFHDVEIPFIVLEPGTSQMIANASALATLIAIIQKYAYNEPFPFYLGHIFQFPVS